MMQQEFEKIYRETYRDIFAYTVACIRDVGNTDDLLQTVYTSFFRRMLRKGTMDVESARKYLIKSVKHELTRYYGHLKRQKEIRSLSDEDAVDGLEYEFAQEEYPDLSQGALMQEIWQMIEERGEVTKRLFILHFRLGLTIRESAEYLQISESNATSRIYRTLNELKNTYREVP
ncbi:RNA polymerase sigma factor [Zongyangia hominis]|nr:RNA polymerase sigma factor [Zongyangia hominis]